MKKLLMLGALVIGLMVAGNAGAMNPAIPRDIQAQEMAAANPQAYQAIQAQYRESSPLGFVTGGAITGFFGAFLSKWTGATIGGLRNIYFGYLKDYLTPFGKVVWSLIPLGFESFFLGGTIVGLIVMWESLSEEKKAIIRNFVRNNWGKLLCVAPAVLAVIYGISKVA